MNCAGLHCDRIARLAGDDPGMRIVPFRGEYYELARARSWCAAWSTRCPTRRSPSSAST